MAVSCNRPRTIMTRMPYSSVVYCYAFRDGTYGGLFGIRPSPSRSRRFARKWGAVYLVKITVRR